MVLGWELLMAFEMVFVTDLLSGIQLEFAMGRGVASRNTRSRFVVTVYVPPSPRLGGTY